MPALTSDDWKYYALTPACGKAYYNKKADQTVIDYSAKIKLCYNRKPNTREKWACCYHDCETFRKEPEDDIAKTSDMQI